MRIIIYDKDTLQIKKELTCRSENDIPYDPVTEDWVEIVSKDCDVWAIERQRLQKRIEDKEKEKEKKIKEQLFNKDDADLLAMAALDKTTIDEYFDDVYTDPKDTLRMIIKYLINRRGVK